MSNEQNIFRLLVKYNFLTGTGAAYSGTVFVPVQRTFPLQTSLHYPFCGVIHLPGNLHNVREGRENCVRMVLIVNVCFEIYVSHEV